MKLSAEHKKAHPISENRPATCFLPHTHKYTNNAETKWRNENEGRKKIILLLRNLLVKHNVVDEINYCKTYRTDDKGIAIAAIEHIPTSSYAQRNLYGAGSINLYNIIFYTHRTEFYAFSCQCLSMLSHRVYPAFSPDM